MGLFDWALGEDHFWYRNITCMLSVLGNTKPNLWKISEKQG